MGKMIPYDLTVGEFADSGVRSAHDGSDGSRTIAAPVEGEKEKTYIKSCSNCAITTGLTPSTQGHHGLSQGAKHTLASIDGPPADKKHFTIMPAFDVVTNPRLAYLRLRGRNPKAYLTGKTVAERIYYNCSDDELNEVADRARHLSAEAGRVRGNLQTKELRRQET